MHLLGGAMNPKPFVITPMNRKAAHDVLGARATVPASPDVSSHHRVAKVHLWGGLY
jgi:hypothetical protein